MAAWAAVAVAVVSGAVSYDQNRKAAAAQKEAQEVSSAQQQAEALRQRRMEARKARIQRARIMQASVNTGVGGSSGEAGAVAGVSNNQAQNNSYLSGQQVAATAISSNNQRAADAQFRSQIAGQIGQLASSEMQTGNMNKAFTNLFN